MQEYWGSFEEVQHSQGRKGAEPLSEELRRSTLGAQYGQGKGEATTR